MIVQSIGRVLFGVLLLSSFALLAQASTDEVYSKEVYSETGYVSVVHGDRLRPDGRLDHVQVYLFDNGSNSSLINLPEGVIASFGGLENIAKSRVELTFARVPASKTTGDVAVPTARRVLSVKYVDDQGAGVSDTQASVNSHAELQISGTNADLNSGLHPFKAPWLNILVKFSDQASIGFDHNHINTRFQDSFRGIEDFWKEASMGEIDIDGTMTRETVVEMPNTTAYYVYDDGAGFGDRLDLGRFNTDLQVKIDQGELDLSGFGGLNVFFKQLSIGNFSWGSSSGFGLVAGVTYNTETSGYLISHEMGHGFSLHHSSSEKGLLNSDQYDNAYDVMGEGANYDSATGTFWPNHINAYYKWKLDVLSSANVVDSRGQDWRSGQTLHLRPHQLHQATDPAIAVIRLPGTRGSTDDGGVFTVEVRGQSNYDGNLPSKSVHIYRVEKHYDDIESFSSFSVLQTDDVNVGGSGPAAEWRVGEVYQNAQYGIEVEVLSEDVNGFNVRIVAPLAEPDTVKNVAASDLTFADKVRISWGAVDGAQNYKVFRCTSFSTSDCGTEFSANGTSFDDTSAVELTTYYYRVQACNAAGCSPFTFDHVDLGRRDLAAPGVPNKPTASDAVFVDKIQLTWQSVDKASSYQLYRCTSLEISDCALLSNRTSLTYDDFGAEALTAYYYRLKACNSSGCSGFSGADMGQRALAAPVAPSQLVASDALYTDRVDVAWSLVPGADRYKVYRCASASGSCDVQATVTAAQYNDTNAVALTNYYYRVSACNASGCSALSSADRGTRALAVPSIEIEPMATLDTFDDRVRITWQGSAQATAYKVYRCTDDGVGSCDRSFDTAAVSFDDLTALALITYRYRVAACNASGCGAYDTYFTRGRRALAIPNAPQSVVASDQTFSNKVAVSWVESDRASSYELYVCTSEQLASCTLIQKNTNTQYDDFNVQAGISYYYRVKACNVSGCSAYSLPARGGPELVTPETPRNLAASDLMYSTKIKVTWEQVVGTTTYQLYRCPSSASESCRLIARTGATAHNDVGVVAVTNYYYRIQACNSAGCSAISDYDIGQMNTPRPPLDFSIAPILELLYE